MLIDESNQVPILSDIKPLGSLEPPDAKSKSPFVANHS